MKSPWKKSIALFVGSVMLAALVLFSALPADAAASRPQSQSPDVYPLTPPPIGKTVTGSVRSGGVDVRNAPGGPSLEKLTTGSPVKVLGRSADGVWLLVTSLQHITGWVERDRVTLFDYGLLPLIATPSPAAVSPPIATPAPRGATAAAVGLPGKLALAGADGSILLYELGSGKLQRLTDGFDPAISPDGSQVAFIRCGKGLYVINSDGSGERKLFSGEELRAPAWNPAGTLIAFSREISPGQRGLGRVALDGSDFRDIPTQPNANSPSWTEQGIAYQSRDGLQITQDGPHKDADGGFINRQVTRWTRHQDPIWQPDGGLIAFFNNNQTHREIYTIGPDGQGMTALTRPADALARVYPHNVAPVWSPDGEQIAFLSNRDGDWAVYVMGWDGSNQRRLPLEMAFKYDFQNEQTISWGR